LIEYSFGERKATVEFSEVPTGVKVLVEFDSENSHPVEQQKQGWQAILNRFTRYVEESNGS